MSGKGRIARTSGLARLQQIDANAANLSTKAHFTTEECKALIRIYEVVSDQSKFDRLRFQEFLHSCLGITDDLMLDLMFKVFDRNNDGVIDDNEFIIGLSFLLRGTPDELTETCYFIYDMNGDRSLAREELYQCLKGCIVPGYGVDTDEIEDAERDIVEIIMKKLDVDRDSQITPDDFKNACILDPLLMQSCGPCLPSHKNIATFFALFTEDYRSHAGAWMGSLDNTNQRSRLSAWKSMSGRSSTSKSFYPIHYVSKHDLTHH